MLRVCVFFMGNRILRKLRKLKPWLISTPEKASRRWLKANTLNTLILNSMLTIYSFIKVFFTAIFLTVHDFEFQYVYTKWDLSVTYCVSISYLLYFKTTFCTMYVAYVSLKIFSDYNSAITHKQLLSVL